MRSLLSAIFWFYYGLCILVFFIVIFFLYILTYPFDPYHVIPNRFLKGLGILMIYINPWWDVEIRGIEQYTGDEPAIFVANHQSFLDMPLTYLLPWSMKWVAKKSLFRIPVLGWLIKMTGHLGIDRESTRSIKKLDKLVEPINEGIPAMIFPEGTRTRTGELRRFKTGAFLLAKQYNFTIHPLVLDGGHKALPSGSWRFKFKQKLIISILGPIDPRKFDSKEKLKNYTYRQIERELENIRSGID